MTASLTSIFSAYAPGAFGVRPVRWMPSEVPSSGIATTGVPASQRLRVPGP